MNQKRAKRYLTKQRKKKLVSDALSKLGSIGGRARAEKLSPERRREIATKASKAAARARTKRVKDRLSGSQ